MPLVLFSIPVGILVDRQARVRLMIGLGLVSAFLLWRRGALPRLLLWGLVGMTFSGWVAVLAGWYVTEIGRQPWLVQGVLRTADAASATPAPLIGLSLSMYLALYLGLILAYVSVLFHLARRRKPVVAAADAPAVDEGVGA